MRAQPRAEPSTERVVEGGTNRACSTRAGAKESSSICRVIWLRLNGRPTPKGVVSMRDMVAEDVVGGREVPVDELCRGRPLWVIEPTASVCDAAQLMVSNKIGCLPVVDDAGAVVGVVTRADVIGAMDGRLPEDGVKVTHA